MGAWSASNFGNDDAADLVGDVVEGGGVERIDAALATAEGTAAGEDLEAPDGSEALAAAELVAAAAGVPVADEPDAEDAIEWAGGAAEIATADRVASAIAATRRVLAERSELRELWDEAGEDAEWRSHVDDLLRRLGEAGA